VIDESVVNELMMWLVGGLAWTEANISQKYKMNGRGDKDRSDDCHGS